VEAFAGTWTLNASGKLPELFHPYPAEWVV
jgi:hypothetical protein